MARPAPAAIAGAKLPPAQPGHILRGHSAPIHSILFLKSNLWLLSGDAEGYIVLWTLTIKRPLAVWKAHEGSILGLGIWGSDRLITHGRDNRLRAWSLDDLETSDAGFSTALPVEKEVADRKQPWLLHALSVSTLNFCSFAGLDVISDVPSNADDQRPTSYLVAVPGSKDSDIEMYELPSEKQVALIPEPGQSSGRVGMVMALALFRHAAEEVVHVACGYENGRACVFKQNKQAAKWEQIYGAQPHSQPILSLGLAPSLDVFFTSSADAVVAKHPLYAATGTLKEVQTKHSGQQGLRARNDGKIFATAGWDNRVRVYSAKTLEEVAVLKWHREGCYALDFARLQTASEDLSGNILTHQTVAQAREARTKETHWLAAGSKDGKISLWDIY